MPHLILRADQTVDLETVRIPGRVWLEECGEEGFVRAPLRVDGADVGTLMMSPHYPDRVAEENPLARDVVYAMTGVHIKIAGTAVLADLSSATAAELVETAKRFMH